MDKFALGFVAGALLFAVFWMLSAATYRKTLLDIAKNNGREKLPDGEFYAIVHESEFNEMKRQSLRSPR
jgi:hypothetical protein